MLTIVLTGGGTAGHVMPNIALLPELKKRFGCIHYVGSTPLEESLVRCENIPYHKITSVKLDRSKLFSNLKIPYLLQKGIKEARELLKLIAPSVVFAKGGYVSLPACIAAKMMNIPVICHESDYTLGLANKIMSVLGAKIITSFPETKGGLYIGNPVRKEIYESSRNTPSLPPKLDPKKKTVLICGGSSGSIAINSAVYNNLTELTKKYNVVHISGKNGNFDIDAKNYLQFKYCNNFPYYLHLCDLIVCRSGSNTLFEAASLGKPCLTIPLPKSVSRGDQILNAKSFARQGYCEILPQNELCSDKFSQSIEKCFAMRPKALNVGEINKKIVDTIVSYI